MVLFFGKLFRHGFNGRSRGRSNLRLMPALAGSVWGYSPSAECWSWRRRTATLDSLLFIINLALDVLLIQRAVELFSSRTWGSDGTEPPFVFVGGRGVAVAKRRPAVVRVVAVAAAPMHPVVA